MRIFFCYYSEEKQLHQFFKVREVLKEIVRRHD